MEAASGLRNNNSSATVPTTPTSDLRTIEPQDDANPDDRRPASSAATLYEMTQNQNITDEQRSYHHGHIAPNQARQDDQLVGDYDDSDDDIPPQVPTRRSSKAASHRYALVNPRINGQRVSTRPNAIGMAIRPPLPPMPPLEPYEQRDLIGVEIIRGMPKNVWSPSGSSVASSSFGSQSLTHNQSESMVETQDRPDTRRNSQSQQQQQGTRTIVGISNGSVGRRKNPPPPPPPRSQQTKLQGGSMDSSIIGEILSQSSASLAPTIVERQKTIEPPTGGDNVEENLANDANKLAEEALSAAMKIPAPAEDQFECANYKSYHTVEPQPKQETIVVDHKTVDDGNIDVNNQRNTNVDETKSTKTHSFKQYNNDAIYVDRRQSVATTAPSAKSDRSAALKVNRSQSINSQPSCKLAPVTAVKIVNEGASFQGAQNSSSTGTSKKDGQNLKRLAVKSKLEIDDQQDRALPSFDEPGNDNADPRSLNNNNNEEQQTQPDADGNVATAYDQIKSHEGSESWTSPSSSTLERGKNEKGPEQMTSTSKTNMENNITVANRDYEQFDNCDVGDDSFNNSDLELDLDLNSDVFVNIEQEPLKQSEIVKASSNAASGLTDTASSTIATACNDVAATANLQLDHKESNTSANNNTNGNTRHDGDVVCANNNNNMKDEGLLEGEAVVCRKSHVTRNRQQQTRHHNDECLMADYDTQMKGSGNAPAQILMRNERDFHSNKRMELRSSYKIPLQNDGQEILGASDHSDKKQQQQREIQSSSLGRVNHQNKYLQQIHQQTENPKEKWFQRMYSQMHAKPNSSSNNHDTEINSLLQAVNSQPQDSTSQICVKLKSPKTDHRYSPSYFSEEDFDQYYGSKSQKPGSISDYEPGQSSIINKQQQQHGDQHERNLVSITKLLSRSQLKISPRLNYTTYSSFNLNTSPPYSLTK